MSDNERTEVDRLADAAAEYVAAVESEPKNAPRLWDADRAFERAAGAYAVHAMAERMRRAEAEVARLRDVLHDIAFCETGSQAFDAEEACSDIRRAARDALEEAT